MTTSWSWLRERHDCAKLSSIQRVAIWRISNIKYILICLTLFWLVNYSMCYFIGHCVRPATGVAIARWDKDIPLPAKPSPNPDDTAPIVRCPMGLPDATGCGRSWTRTRVSGGTASTVVQCKRQLCHSGGLLLIFYCLFHFRLLSIWLALVM